MGGIVSGTATLLGHGDQAEQLGQQVASSVTEGAKADEARQAAAVAANRYRAEAAQARSALDDGKSEAVIALIRRPTAERNALAQEYQRQFGTPMFYAITVELKDPVAVQRATAIWMGDNVLADRIALQGDLANQQKVESAAREVEESLVGQAREPRGRRAREAPAEDRPGPRWRRA